MSVKKLAIMFGLAVFVAASSCVWAQNDPLGKTDTVTLKVTPVGTSQWMVSMVVWNDEPLAAVDIPIRYTAGMAKLVVDSVSFKGTRMEAFAQKYGPVDTANQMMHVGGLAYMGPDKPPLAPGDGEMARVYISMKDEKKPAPFAIDTTTMAPNSSLMLVDANAKIIIPVLKIATAGAGKEVKKDEKKTPPKKK